MSQTVQFELVLKLSVRGFECSPKEITDIMGVAPTKSWAKGEPSSPKLAPSTISGWILESPKSSQQNEIEGQLVALLGLFPDSNLPIARLPHGAKPLIECVVRAYAYWPGIRLTRKASGLLWKQGIDLDFDLYDLIESNS